MTTMEIPTPRIETTDPQLTAAGGVGHYRVQDQHQVLEFDGERIGFASTETPDTVRWTEIEIFRTVSGNYVVHRVGASVVYHDAKAHCASGGLTTPAQLIKEDLAAGSTSATVDDNHEPCEKCRPLVLSRLPGDFPIRREADRHSADSVRSPEELVKALSLRRPNGSSYLSAVARDALAAAARQDQKIAALTNQTVYIP